MKKKYITELEKINKLYIKGKKPGEYVTEKVVTICQIKNNIRILLKLPLLKVYISTKVLKHIYEQRPDYEYELILQNLDEVLTEPDAIYQNAKSKRGTFIFKKNLNKNVLMASIEVVKQKKGKKEIGIPYIVTAFSPREGYFKKFRKIFP